jgi:S-adenosylmethionine decarboxylase
MFPERQLGPHRDWKEEVKYLDDIFHNGAAYTVGKVNGDHWLLYITSPGDDQAVPSSPVSPQNVIDCRKQKPPFSGQDYTIEILMSDLAPSARRPFGSASEFIYPETPSSHAQALSSSLGISEIFPPHLTTLDAYSFSPCGYSSNALLKWGSHSNGVPNNTNDSQEGEGYYTIHVTPEEGWSYASFECNVPLPTDPSPQRKHIPDLQTLIRRVVSIFQPRRLTLTLFISSEDNSNTEDEAAVTAVEGAQRAFKAALTAVLPETSNGYAGQEIAKSVYKRTDKINYKFGGYDLAFASFELCR